jgi:hypothetical protein
LLSEEEKKIVDAKAAKDEKSSFIQINQTS